MQIGSGCGGGSSGAGGYGGGGCGGGGYNTCRESKKLGGDHIMETAGIQEVIRDWVEMVVVVAADRHSQNPSWCKI
jgi:hypothetical protein